MTPDEELKQIPELSAVGTALMQFAASLTEGEFIRQRRQWIYRPNNFVSFTIQHKRAKNIVLSLYGTVHQHQKDRALGLYSGQGYYSRCEITKVRQLAAAANYIQQSFELKEEKTEK